MTEKRIPLRHKRFLRGVVCSVNSNSTIDCIVRDISENGARIKFSSPRTIFGDIDLHIPIRGQTYRAKVLWSCDDEIGIAFEPTAVDASQSSDDELVVRVKRLESEIVALKQLIMRLQKNVVDKTDAA